MHVINVPSPAAAAAAATAKTRNLRVPKNLYIQNLAETTPLGRPTFSWQVQRVAA